MPASATSVPDPLWRPVRAARALAAREARFARLLERVGPPAIQTYPSSFESIGRAIAYQQLTGRAARTIWNRVLARVPEGGLTPERVLRMRLATLRAAGLSEAKARSLKDLARHVADGTLRIEELPDLPDEEVVARLTQVRGIGPWSAHMHLIFALKRRDVWPTADYGMRKGLQRYYGLGAVPAPREAAPLGDFARPWRSVFAWYLWRLE